MKDINIIVAIEPNGGFAAKGKIPWHFSEDLKRFKGITKDSICVMGRKTYNDLYNYTLKDKILKLEQSNKESNKNLESYKLELLPGRESIVLSRSKNLNLEGQAIRLTGIRESLEYAKRKNKKLFFIGGEKIFVEGLCWANKVYMTIIKEHYDCDRFFPLDYLKKYFTLRDGKETKELYFTEWDRTRNG